MEELQSIIKKTLFRPLFFNFPDLDRFPRLFPQRKVAFGIMQEFSDLLVETVRNRNKDSLGIDGEQVVDRLDRALKEGLINEEQYRDNLKVTFLTAHENAQQLLNSAFWELGNNQAVQRKLRAEVLATSTQDPSTDLVNSLPYLFSVVLELLRLYPPVSQLINRVTTQKAVLGGDIAIPNHTWVGWNAFGVQTDQALWGPDAREFRPERWGSEVKSIQSNMRIKTTQCHFIAFNAHSRKCLGQGFAVLQMKILLFEMVRRIEWVVDPGYQLRLTSVSALGDNMFLGSCEVPGWLMYTCREGYWHRWDCGWLSGNEARIRCPTRFRVRFDKGLWTTCFNVGLLLGKIYFPMISLSPKVLLYCKTRFNYDLLLEIVNEEETKKKKKK